MTIVYKNSIDLFLYVVGSSYENEVNSGGWGSKKGCLWGNVIWNLGLRLGPGGSPLDPSC